MTTGTKPQRRSSFQVHVAKKLRYSVRIDGDTGKGKRSGYVVLSRCTQPWRYWLFDESSDADAKLEELNANKCGHDCRQLHSRWLELM